MWIDTHAHLFNFSSNELLSIIDEANENSVGLIVSTATDIETARKVLNHCALSPTIYGAIGISPFDVETQNDNWSDDLKSLLDNEKIIAVGEIGLDDSSPHYPSLQKQLPFFKTQLSIAKDYNIPSIIHSRGAETLTADICKELGIHKAVFHCFTGDYNAAKKILDLGFYISFSGILTFKNAAIRTLIPMLPKERLFIETDTPYLSPVPFRGNPNKPSLVKLVGEEAARLLSIDPDTLQIILEKNFNNCFNIN